MFEGRRLAPPVPEPHVHQPPPTAEDAFLREASRLAGSYARLFILFFFDDCADADADDIAHDIVRTTVREYVVTAHRRLRAAFLAQELCRSARSEGPAPGPDLSRQATPACEQRDNVAA